MISRYEAIMDGTPLSHIDPRLLVLDIQHEISEPSISVGRIVNRNGSIMQNNSQDGSSVTILFELHIYSISERQEVCQKVVEWAKGSVLETNDRIGQQLHVHCTEYPMIKSAMEWTAPLTMTFTAFEKPFWEEKTARTIALSTSTSGTLYVPGNAGKTYVEATVTPSTTLSDITLAVGDTSITLTGCSATPTNKLVISYDDRGFLQIKVGTTSILDKRTGSDDLLAVCGTDNTFSYSTTDSVTVEFAVRGLWM